MSKILKRLIVSQANSKMRDPEKSLTVGDNNYH